MSNNGNRKKVIMSVISVIIVLGILLGIISPFLGSF